jgi:hypothetical protein
VLAETYGRNGIKKVVRSLNPRRKGIILKNSLLASEVSVNRPAQAASPPSAGDYRYLVACLRVRAAECFRAKAPIASASEAIHSIEKEWIASLLRFLAQTLRVCRRQ